MIIQSISIMKPANTIALQQIMKTAIPCYCGGAANTPGSPAWGTVGTDHNYESLDSSQDLLSNDLRSLNLQLLLFAFTFLVMDCTVSLLVFNIAVKDLQMQHHSSKGIQTWLMNIPHLRFEEGHYKATNCDLTQSIVWLVQGGRIIWRQVEQTQWDDATS